MANTSVLTAKGRDMVTGRLKGSTPTQGEFLNIGLDQNPNSLTAAITDVAAFQLAAEAIIAGTSSITTTTTPNDTYSVTGTVSITGTETIGGSFLSDSTTKPFATTVTGGSAVGSNSGTALTVAASYTPANGTTIQIRTEVLTVTAGTGTTSLTVTRAANGSAAISTIATSDPVTAGNIPGSTTVTGGDMAIHSSWPVGLALLNGESLTITQTLKFT